MYWFLAQQFVLLLVTAGIFAYFGWWLRPKFQKVGATRAEVDAERGKNQALEDRARKAEAEGKASTAELAALKTSTVPRSELDAAKKALADEQTKSESLQTQLKKARELQIAAESRNTGASKGAQAQVFMLENELAGIREQAARDRQAAIDAQAELERFKANMPGKSDEVTALETELMQARRAFTTSENAAFEAKRARDVAEVDAGKMRDKLKVLEGELAIARGNARAGGAASAEAPQAAPSYPAIAAAEARATEALRSMAIAREEAIALRDRVTALEAQLVEAKEAIPDPATETDIDHVRNALHKSEAEASEAKQAHAKAASDLVVQRTQISALQAEIEKLKAAAHATPAPAPAPAPAPVAEAPAAPVAESAPVA